MTILQSRRVVAAASLISLRSRIIDMKRRAVQQSKGENQHVGPKINEKVWIGGLMGCEKSFGQNWERSRL